MFSFSLLVKACLYMMQVEGVKIEAFLFRYSKLFLIFMKFVPCLAFL